jgi:hypothetical protein
MDFLDLIKPVFGYDQHLRLWKDTFGRQALHVMRFDSVGGNILQNFCERILTPACYQQARHRDFLANTRLSRNVLEVKRIFNATQPDRAYAFTAAAVFQELADLYPDQNGDQIFSEPSTQKVFFANFEEGNRALSLASGFSEVLPVCTQGQPTYHGLSPHMAIEIYMRFQYQMNLPRNKLKVTIRRAARFLKDRIPGGRWLLRPVQIALYRLRLRYLGW